MWDLIVSVPDHCLSFLFSHQLSFWDSGGIRFTLLKVEPYWTLVTL